MSKDILTEKDKKLANIIVDMYTSVDKHTKNIIKLEEQLYKNYQAMALDKQEELDNTSKLFKKKREKLEQELKGLQDTADKHFKYYLDECNNLYDLHTSSIKEEDKSNG